MRIYTVHCREDVLASPTGLADGAVFVKEGFSWPAFLFSPIWPLLKGLWITALLFIGFQFFLAGMLGAGLMSEDLFWLLYVLPNVLLGFEGNELYRRKLGRKALRERGMIVADNIRAAEHRFFSKLEQSGVESALV